MSTEVAPVPEFANPITGEVLTLASPNADLGRYLADLREFEGRVREYKRAVTDELLARMDRSASWTVHAEGVKLSGASPQPSEEWDGPALREALLDLVDEGVLSIEAVDAAVETVVSYKPRKAGINALRKLGGRAAELVAEHRREVEKQRYITVSRA